MDAQVGPHTGMTHVDLIGAAALLPQAWKSTVLGRASGANFKVLRMDASEYTEEIHDYPEALLVIDGHMNLKVHGEPVRVTAGEVFIVPAGVLHGVAVGSTGTLVVVGV